MQDPTLVQRLLTRIRPSEMSAPLLLPRVRWRPLAHRGDDDEGGDGEAAQAEGRHGVEGAQAQAQRVELGDERAEVGGHQGHAARRQQRAQQPRSRDRQLARRDGQVRLRDPGHTGRGSRR
jgi:hypothetical protein